LTLNHAIEVTLVIIDCFTLYLMMMMMITFTD